MLIVALEYYVRLTLYPTVHEEARPDITHIRPDVMYIRPNMFSHLLLNETKSYVIIALRLYLSGTSRNSAWCFRDGLLFVCLVTVSVSLSVFCVLVIVFLFLVLFGASQRREPKLPTLPLFIMGSVGF